MQSNQLVLSETELSNYGFNKKSEDEKTWYELPGINSAFVYNPSEPVYKWYFKTIIGDAANWVHLDMPDAETLQTVLKVFDLTKYDSQAVK